MKNKNKPTEIEELVAEKERHEKVRLIPRKDLINAIILLVDELRKCKNAKK